MNEQWMMNLTSFSLSFLVFLPIFFFWSVKPQIMQRGEGEDEPLGSGVERAPRIHGIRIINHSDGAYSR